jgi:hypothetical protein
MFVMPAMLTPICDKSETSDDHLAGESQKSHQGSLILWLSLLAFEIVEAVQEERQPVVMMLAVTSRGTPPVSLLLLKCCHLARLCQQHAMDRLASNH